MQWQIVANWRKNDATKNFAIFNVSKWHSWLLQIAKLESWHCGVVIYNQLVTWTSFAILAMFSINYMCCVSVFGLIGAFSRIASYTQTRIVFSLSQRFQPKCSWGWKRSWQNSQVPRSPLFCLVRERSWRRSALRTHISSLAKLSIGCYAEYDLSPIYWDLCIDHLYHLYFQHPENAEI